MLAPVKVVGPTSTTTAGGTTTTIGTGLDPGADTGAAPATAMAMVISGTPSALAEEVTPPTEVEAR